MPMNNRLLRPRQTIHPEAADWANRVRTNGGSVSGTTLNAVDRFVKAIHAAGIRDRFYRLNLFCGNSDASLAAVRTPLFRGPSLAGTQYGGTTDTNLNFVQGDYAETGASGGLTGNGISKCLDCGNVFSGVISPASAHLSADGASLTSGPGTDVAVIGAASGAGANICILQTKAASANALRFFASPNTLSTSWVDGSAPIMNGHIVGSAVSNADMRVFSGGLQSGSTNTNTRTGSLTQNNVLVFAYSNNGTPAIHAAARLRSYSIGLGMTASQVASFNAAVVSFNTAMGRT